MTSASPSILGHLIRFCLEQKLVVLLVTALVVAGGVLVAPFDWKLWDLPRSPVAVDAIPDIGDNQQIVFTEWPGRSPQDIDDQITYPLTVALMGIPNVKTVRSLSIFGISSIYVIFDDSVEFYWSRSRILEKLNSLPPGTLPEGIRPALGPDATALGQVFWYTLEGRDEQGRPAAGWDLQELRTIQDFTVRYALMAAEGVSEVASIGGFVQEYQVNVDPDAMRAFGVTLDQVFSAVRNSNVDVGARTIEVNKVEYIVRGLGFIGSLDDIEQIAVMSQDDVPVLIRDIAHVALGPALRRGVLDKSGAEAVGGVVVVRYGENPMRVIENVKEKIKQLQLSLPRKTLADGTVSQVTVVPFYDRTGLIRETLGTLNEALELEVLVTMIVVLLMVLHLRASALISLMLPLAVLMTFIAMRLFGVDANIVALSGIAIAVGTIVDMGIVVCENILKRLDQAGPEDDKLEVVYQASTEVGSAVFTAVLTTIVSFLPVFTMTGEEGKLFRPLAFTKTFALIGAIIVALAIIPPLAHMLFAWRIRVNLIRVVVWSSAAVVGLIIALLGFVLAGLAITAIAGFWLARPWLPKLVANLFAWSANLVAVGVILVILAGAWEPLGVEMGTARNLIAVSVLIVGLIMVFWLFRLVYPVLLRASLWVNPVVPLLIILTAGLLAPMVWLGAEKTFSWLPTSMRSSDTVTSLTESFPGLGSEFMPALDEGSFLYMPTMSAHASIGEALDAIQKMDMAITAIPEVDQVVGKIGRVESPLDPAPISMVETVITYHPEYILATDGRRARFRYDKTTQTFDHDDHGELIPDDNGKPFRQWRDHIRSPEDIWKAISIAAKIPGSTGAPKLQPIETRLVMLRSGFRAAMGIKVYGPDLATIEEFGIELERVLKMLPSIKADTVLAERIVGKPYLEINIDRERIARYGITVRDVQNVIEVAIGGRPLTMTVEGRERYSVRVRYMRELRDQIETLGDILVATPDKRQVPLAELSTIEYSRGPQTVKSEDTLLVGYVTFDKMPGLAETGVVEEAQAAIEGMITRGELEVPEGVRFVFSGTYENQVRANQRLMIIFPAAILIIFLILYFQFRSVLTTIIVGLGVGVALSGGFGLLWLYGQNWFMTAQMFTFLPPRPEALLTDWWAGLEVWLGTPVRELLQIRPINWSVAVGVGFLALFGIATDDGVVMATRLKQSFSRQKPRTLSDIRNATVDAGRLRIRACLMTTATTILALLPVLTSSGRGSDIMIPMAIPIFGGMAVELLTLFVVPTLFCGVEQLRWLIVQLMPPASPVTA